MTTVGRPKRKRSPSAGGGVSVKPHTRTPRGRNSGKKGVKVDSYKRGKPRKRRRARAKRA